MEKIGVYCASSNTMAPEFYEKARELGAWMGREGKTLVYGGIACGLMEAVAQAVKQNGGRVYGVVPKGLTLRTGPSDAIDVTLWCDDLTDRKTWLIQESDVLVVLPGSLGTLDDHGRPSGGHASEADHLLEPQRLLRPALCVHRPADCCGRRVQTVVGDHGQGQHPGRADGVALSQIDG